MEHRCGTRYPVDLVARIRIRKRSWCGGFVGKLTDVSSSGAFVCVPPDAFRRLATVQLELRLPGTDRFLNCRAMVVRSTAEGIGLAFDQQQPVQLTALFLQEAPAGLALPVPWQGL